MIYNRSFSGLLVILTLSALVQSNSARAQKSKGEKVAAAATVAAGLLAAAFEVHQLYEMLELKATEQALLEHPGIDASGMEVKVFELPEKSITDISNESVMVFSVRFYDLETSLEKERKILMALTSPGWVNANGLEYSKVEWVWYDKLRWKDFWSKLITISTPFEVENNEVPVIAEVDRSFYRMRPGQFYIQRLGSEKKRTVDFYQHVNTTCPIDSLNLTAKGFSYTSKTDGADNRYLPQYNLSGDQYVFGNFEPGVLLVVNEGTVGLYRESTKRLVQLQRSLVNNVQEWMQFAATEILDPNSRESLSQILQMTDEEIQALIDFNEYRERKRSGYQALLAELKVKQIEKEEYGYGDYGYIEMEPEILVQFRIVGARKNLDFNDFELTLSFQEYNEGGEMKIWASDERLIWISEDD